MTYVFYLLNFSIKFGIQEYSDRVSTDYNELNIRLTQIHIRIQTCAATYKFRLLTKTYSEVEVTEYYQEEVRRYQETQIFHLMSLFLHNCMETSQNFMKTTIKPTRFSYSFFVNLWQKELAVGKPHICKESENLASSSLIFQNQVHLTTWLKHFLQQVTTSNN